MEALTMQVMKVGLSIVAMRRAPKTPAQAVPSVPAPPSGQSSATSSAPKTPACAAVPPVSFCIAPVCMHRPHLHFDAVLEESDAECGYMLAAHEKCAANWIRTI